MQELINKTLGSMQSLADKAVLKDVLNDVFLSLHAESERKYSALEQRVRDELPLIFAPYIVYSTVLQRSHIEAGHNYLSPMIPAEMEDSSINISEAAATLKNNEQPVIGTVFYEADYLKCRRLELDKPVFDGVFHVKSTPYPFKFRLKPTTRYSKLVEALYGIFLRNDVPWTTINCAYLNKFFDVVLLELPQIPPTGSIIRQEQIKYSFEQHEGSIRRGIIPVWNIDKHRVKGDDFPTPAIDNVNYEYHFDTSKLGVENGFLVDYDSAYILSVRREGNSVVAVSPRQKGLSWDMYRIRCRQDRAVDSYQYPILSNARYDSFSARLTAEYGMHIATKAELRKLISSFAVSEYVELETMHFIENRVLGETYSMNPFILDELRDSEYKKVLSLNFRAKNKDFFLNRDLISFLVSQVQMVYPEYNCKGALL